MIISKPTRFGAGLTIYGDYWDLKNMHEMIYRLSDGSPLEGTTLSDFVLGLAYDIRHAYQGNRLKETFGFDELDMGKYRGVQVLWPIVIPQIILLRWAAGFHPTSRRDQANLFLLEHCVEEALEEYDREIGKKAFDTGTIFQGMSPNYYTQFISEVARRYVCEGKAGKTRFKRLPEMLRMMSPISDEYREFAAFIEEKAKEKGTDPHELQDWSDWPEFRW